MTAQELFELLANRPFQPLRLRLADGRIREIHCREMALVSEDLVAIGIPADKRSKVARRVTRCALSEIVEIERMQSGRKT